MRRHGGTAARPVFGCSSVRPVVAAETSSASTSELLVLRPTTTTTTTTTTLPPLFCLDASDFRGDESRPASLGSRSSSFESTRWGGPAPGSVLACAPPRGTTTWRRRVASSSGSFVSVAVGLSSPCSYKPFVPTISVSFTISSLLNWSDDQKCLWPLFFLICFFLLNSLYPRARPSSFLTRLYRTCYNSNWISPEDKFD